MQILLEGIYRNGYKNKKDDVNCENTIVGVIDFITSGHFDYLFCFGIRL
jgi:hypothetical protein